MAEEFAQETVGPKDGVDWSTQLDKASDQDNITAPPGSGVTVSRVDGSVNRAGLEAVPAGVATVMAPEEIPFGTVA